MEVDVARLKKNTGGSVDIAFKVSPDRLGGELAEDVSVVKPLAVTLHLTNTNPVILVEGNLTTQVQLRCSRCLATFKYDLAVPISEGFLALEEQEQQVDRAEEESLAEEFSFFTGSTIDLRETIRENLVAALPMKALCQSECRGLCLRCGQNLNQGECSCRQKEPDPRLQVLAKLLEKEST